MKVVAIMPSFNQREFIEEAVASVVDQVETLIVVNDGSTDGTAEWLASRDGIEVVSLAENSGSPAAAINAGFATVPKTDLVTWVSSDNVHHPKWRETLEAAFQEDVGVVYSAYLFGMQGRSMHTPYDPNALINHTDCFFGPSFLIRKDVWDLVGEHRGRISHDYDHWLRVEEVCQEGSLRIVSIADVLCKYRVHPKRVTVLRRHEFDAPHWQQEARKRRHEAKQARG